MRKVSVILIVLFMVFLFPFFAHQVEAAKEKDVEYSTISSIDELQELIDTGLKESSADQIDTAKTGDGAVHKITLKEDGIIAIRCYTNDGRNAKCTLYSNEALTSKLNTVYCSDINDPDSVLIYFVPAGTYYYQTNRWNGDKLPLINTCYVGFIPVSKCMQVKKVTYSKDKSIGYLHLGLSDYFKENGTEIKIIRGSAIYTKLRDYKTWREHNIDNYFSDKVVPVTQNGKYSLRITAADENMSCFIQTTVKGIKEKLSDVKINKRSAGKNLVSGTADPYTNIIVSIGNKEYKTTTNKKGAWNIKTEVNLQKKDVIIVYSINEAGTKSKQVKATVY